ncbi:hypothetical protein D3C83_44340 [compost metagenome]
MRFGDGADMRPDDAEHAAVQHLLGDPLVHLDAVGRDAHHRRHRGRDRARLDDLPPVQQVLQAVAQRGGVVGLVLHLEHHAVVAFHRDRLRRRRLGRAEAHEYVLALLEDLDDAVQPRDVHLSVPFWSPVTVS